MTGGECERAREIASALLDDEATAEERRWFASHRDDCPACARHADGLARLHRRSRLSAASAVPDLTDRILSSPAAGEPSRRRRGIGVVAVAAGLIALAGLGAVLLGARRAEPEPMSSPVVVEAYAPESSGIAAVYLTIENTGGDDRLVGASSDVGAGCSLHVTERRNGLLYMVPADGFDVGGGSTLVLEPTSAHVMLDGLERDLVVGDTVTIHLHFERAGRLATDVEVVALDELVDRIQAGPATATA